MALLSTIGGIVGHFAGAGDRKRAKELRDQAAHQYDDLHAPEITPIEQRELDRSMYTGMPSNFGGRDFEDEALARMAEFGREGGLGAQGNLAMEQARIAGAAQGNRANAAIQQNAARRGMGGAGSIVAQQVAQQGANQTASLGGMQAAAAAENQRMGATQALGGMASQVEGRRNAAAMERARQLDAINQFEARLGLQTDMANRGFQQQTFQNNLGLADRRYGAGRTLAGDYQGYGDDSARMFLGIGQGLDDTSMAIAQTMLGMPPTAAMGGGKGGAFAGAGASGSASAQGPMMYPSAGAYPGPVQPKYDPQLFSTNWWDYAG